MTKLNQKEREMFYKIIESDLETINRTVEGQINNIWDFVREQVIVDWGYDKLQLQKEQLQREIEVLQGKIMELERKMRPENLTREQLLELGGMPDRYGGMGSAHFYGIPVKSKLDYEIVKRIRANINLDAPAKFLHDLGRSTMRELTMSGSFEQAQQVYTNFYKLDFRKYGVDIPPRLTEIKQTNPLLEPSKGLKIESKIKEANWIKKDEEVEDEQV